MVRNLLKTVLPGAALSWYRRIREARFANKVDKVFADKEPKFIFSAIYNNHWWGEGDGYFSGHGSRDPKYVIPYVESVGGFLSDLPESPSVVDLGCGDFCVGSQLTSFASTYTACDVVGELVESLKQKYDTSNLRFLSLDITTDPLPPGDVGILRQVLQHLSNEQISAVIAKVNIYRYLIVAEYLPIGQFEPNVDQPCGAHSRIARGINSGIVLTCPPFGLRVLSERVISDVQDETGVLRTIAYRLQ